MKKILYLICVICLIFVFSCSKKVENHSNIENDFGGEKSDEIEVALSPEEIEKQKYENAVSDFISKMTLEEKIGQMFLVTIGGTEFSDLYYDVENFIAPGGYLLFAYNFVNGEQGINFTSDIENWFGKNDLIKPYFSVDQEGGLVNRLRDVASPLPSASSVAKFLKPDLAKAIYDYAAMQLVTLGIHVNLGPVVEILTEENQEFLDTRSFGDKDKVGIYSDIFIKSMLENDVYPVAKHFPGNNAVDPHLGLPVIDFDLSKVNDILIAPFEKIEDKENIGVLVAHSVVPAFFDGNEAIPSCLSKKVVTELLENQLGYNGLIFSDDLLMAALQENGYDSVEAISMAIKAGINVLMIAQKEYMPFIEEIVKLAENDEEMLLQIEKSAKKIVDFKVKKGLLNYSEEKIQKGKGLSDEELAQYQSEKYENFLKAYNQGKDFYQMYWGN